MLGNFNCWTERKALICSKSVPVIWPAGGENLGGQD